MCEIFNSSDTSNGWFGKKHILLFGDLLQLPPVHEGSPFVDLSSETLTKCAGSLACPNIWVELVTYDELTINMRQAQDSHYADILSRIRIGQMNPSDADFLANKRISLGGQTIQENMSYLADYLGNLPTDAVCLCATGHQCAKINEEMLNRIQETQVDLTAIDSVHCAPHNKSKASKLLSSTDCSRTAGMEQKISVKVGCKIMLRRNIDVTLGLVNSAIGIIQEIKRRENKVHSLIVQFQNGIVRSLERLSVKFELMDNVYVYREQFPISLSYAVTIHKCQGLSLENVLMDIGETVFTCGQTYVALSRVTSSEGLHIINFAPRQVKALDSAVLEYNRLRQKYRPDLPLMHGPTQVLLRYVPDRKWFQSKQAEVIQSAQENVIKPTKKAKRSTAKASLQNQRPV